MATGAPVATAKQSELAVDVHGNVAGSIVVGHHNLVVNDNHGTIVYEPTTPTRRRRPPAGPPRAPIPFVGRGTELARLGGAINARRAITVSGPSGAGRTAMLRVAAGRPEATLRDGVLRVDGVDDEGTALTVGDLAQRLHDAAWETVPLVKVTFESARPELAQVEAIALVDDVTLSGDDLERLADLLPLGAVVASTATTPPDSDLDDVSVGALDRSDAMMLVAARSGLPASADLGAVCELLGDWPEALVIAGRAIAVRALTADAVRAELEAVAASDAAPSQVSIERAWALAKPALDPNTRRLLTAASTLPGRTHDADLLRRIVGEPPWFDDAAATLAALALLTFNSPRLRVPDGVRVLVRDEAGTLADDIADRSVDVLLMAASERALDPDFVTDELGGLLGAFDHAVRHGRFDDAVDLGRAFAPQLVLHGLWDAWLTVARGVGAAADHAGRSADAAWALHEIGTRNLALGDIAAATPLLLQALAIRRDLGDTQGAAYTLHNLRWFGLVGGGGGGGGTGIGRFLLGGGALVIGLAILAITGPPVAGFVVDLIAPARSPAPTAVASASGRPTSEPTHQPTPTPVQPSLPPRGLTVATRVGEYEFAGGGWVTSLEVSLTGGVGRYHVTIDKVGESGENPATFKITGTACEAITVTGQARSGATILVPIKLVIGPTSCPTPTPPSVACVTFDDIPIGTTYGAKGGQRPGDAMFTTAEGIRTTVDEFQVADIKAKTTLYRAVPAGATSITVGSLEGFQPGMTIRIDDAAAEEATIRDFGSDGVQRTLVLASPLASAHPVEATVYGYVVGRPFGAAVVREPRADIGIGPLLFVNNVDIGFDFTSLPFRPSSVDFAYRNYGGRENLSVDGSEVYRGEIGAAPNGMGGAHWSSADPEGDGSWIGTFNGPVDRFAVGGQEFALDQVCAHP